MKMLLLAITIASSILLVVTSSANPVAIFFPQSSGTKVGKNDYMEEGVLLQTSPWQYLVSKKIDYDSADLFVMLKNPTSLKKNNGKVVITLVVPGTKKPGMTGKGILSQIAVRDERSKGFTVMCRDINRRQIECFREKGSGLVYLPAGTHWIILKPIKLGPTLSAIYLDGKIVKTKGTAVPKAVEMNME